HRGWSHVALTDHGARTLGMTAGWHGPLIGQVAGTYWMPDTTPMGACRMRSVALSFKSSGVTATYGKWVATDGSPDEVSADPVGGLYVAMGAQLCQPQSLSAIAYYSADALKSAAPRPSAEQDESDINQMVTDPAGGVVLVTGGTLLQHWTH
ncbi:MAG: hypothetical protein ACTHK4_17875, partial [Mycobacteriales bacterium]